MAKRKKKPKEVSVSGGWAAFAYLAQLIPILGLVIAVLIYWFKKDSFNRFHALQAAFVSIAFSIIAVILSIIPVGGVLLPLLTIILLLVLLYAAFKSYGGAELSLPIVGNLARSI